jgi:hypothetical protein
VWGCWLASTGFPEDKLGVHQGERLCLFVIQEADQLADSLAANLFDRRADSGQRRREVPGGRDVVETDHGHIPGDEASGCAEGTHHTDGRVIVPGEDRIEVLSFRQQLLNGFKGFLIIEPPGCDEFRVEIDAIGFKSLPISALTPV